MLYSTPYKVYDYMAAGRPILGLAPPGAALFDFLEESGAGTCVESGDDPGMEARARKPAVRAERRARAAHRAVSLVEPRAKYGAVLEAVAADAPSLHDGSTVARGIAARCPLTQARRTSLTAINKSGAIMRPDCAVGTIGRAARGFGATLRRMADTEQLQALLDRWQTSLDLHAKYAALDDARYWHVQPWPKHERPQRWIIQLARKRILALKRLVAQRTPKAIAPSSRASRSWASSRRSSA